MEPTLQLNVEDRSAVQEVVLQNLKSEDWQQLEAAIFVANGMYVYKRKVSDHPLAFEYKCLSPETLQRAFHIKRLDTGWLGSISLLQRTSDSVKIRGMRSKPNHDS